MSDRSTIGSMPWLNRFMARVTRSTLPVRSPCPNRQPSTRSAPAISASSAAATAVPRSLCGGIEMHTYSRRGQVAVHPLEAVRVRGGGRTLHRGGQVEDDLAARTRLVHVHHRLADLQSE